MPSVPTYMVIAGEQADINRRLAEMGGDWEPIDMNTTLVPGPRFAVSITVMMKRK